MSDYDALMKSLEAIDPRLTEKVAAPEPEFLRDQDAFGNPFRDQIVTYLIQRGWRRCACEKHGWVKGRVQRCLPASLALAAEKSWSR